MMSLQSHKKYNQSLAIVLPVIYLFVAVFIARTEVGYFFLLSILFLLSMLFLVRNSEKSDMRRFAFALLSLASIGLAAASILTIEKIELLKDPSHVTSCSISPVVGCSPVIASKQASAFDGIPNPIFGIFGYTALLTAAMTILAGAQKLSRNWWQVLFAGVVFGTIFCIWLIHEGLYEIGALCLYCVSVWIVTFSLFWLVLTRLLHDKHLSISKQLDSFIVKNRDVLITLSIGIVILLIYFRWPSYWNSLF